LNSYKLIPENPSGYTKQSIKKSARKKVRKTDQSNVIADAAHKRWKRVLALQAIDGLISCEIKPKSQTLQQEPLMLD